MIDAAMNGFRLIQSSNEENGRSSQLLLVSECISVFRVIRCLAHICPIKALLTFLNRFHLLLDLNGDILSNLTIVDLIGLHLNAIARM